MSAMSVGDSIQLHDAADAEKQPAWVPPTFDVTPDHLPAPIPRPAPPATTGEDDHARLTPSAPSSGFTSTPLSPIEDASPGVSPEVSVYEPWAPESATPSATSTASTSASASTASAPMPASSKHHPPPLSGASFSRSPAPTSPRSPRSPSSPSHTSPFFSNPTSASSSNPPSGGRRGRPASALVSSLSGYGGIPKPRSNSSLTSHRPAPPSPAGSRPPSQVIIGSPSISPHVSPRASPGGHGVFATSPPAPVRTTPSPGAQRDRAQSISSTASRRTRPRSALCSNVIHGELPEREAVASSSAAELSATSSATAPEPAPRLGGAEAAETSAKDPADAHESHAESSTSVSGAETPGVPTAPLTLSASIASTLIRRVIVRDYAFPRGDDRFAGLGRNRPYSNWGEGEPEPEKPAPRRGLGGGGMGMFGFSLGLSSWGRSEDDETPEVQSPLDDEPDHTNDEYWSDDPEYDVDDGSEEYADEPDGLYRAAYEFAAVGVNEMAMSAGLLVDVRGRGGGDGGDGWVVAVRLDTGEEGLVPEGYLERADEDEYPDEWEVVRRVRAKLAAHQLAE